MQPKLKNCKHEEVICTGCFNQYIKEQLNGAGKTDLISCPLENCEHILSREETLEFSNYENRKRFDHLKTFKMLSAMDEFRWCKAERCGSGQLHENGEDCPIVTCNACGSKSCYIHQVPFHFGTTCKDYDLFLQENEDQATRDYLQKTPRTAQIVVMR